MPNASPPPDVERVEAPKSCDLLADQLRRNIVSGAYAPGAALPPERDLVARSGLSRGSVREALRILEAEGLVRTRPGRYGGTVVSQPSDDRLARHIEVFAKTRGVSLASLIDAREALEPMVAQRAALARTDEDLASLHALSRQLELAAADGGAAFVQANARWHYALAVASHNDLLRVFMGSLTGLIESAALIGELVDADVRAQVVLAHRRILQAVEAGEADRARRRMERHVLAYSRRANALLRAAHTPIPPVRRARAVPSASAVAPAVVAAARPAAPTAAVVARASTRAAAAAPVRSPRTRRPAP